MLVSISSEKIYSPLKIGLLLVSVVFFLFTLHGLLTLEWIGEWEYFTGEYAFWIFITDVSSAIGLVIRFVGSLVAVLTVGYYFVKKQATTKTVYRLFKIVLIAEAFYWFTFITSGFWGISPIFSLILGNTTSQLTGLSLTIQWLTSMGLPCLFEAIALPLALFKIVFNLNPKKAQTTAIKWGVIAGTFYIFTWWLNNSGMWIFTIVDEGTNYLTAYPENMISFIFTLFGLAALGVFSAVSAKKAFGTGKIEDLNHKTWGTIIIVSGFYFLWNYLTWIFFGRPEIWSQWYAWFMGHNLDLWALSLPLFGLPLLFNKKS